MDQDRVDFEDFWKKYREKEKRSFLKIICTREGIRNSISETLNAFRLTFTKADDKKKGQVKPIVSHKEKQNEKKKDKEMGLSIR